MGRTGKGTNRIEPGEMSSVCLHSLARYLHVVEHTLQLLSELETTLDLELCKHTALCIVRNRATKEESLGEVAFVVTLENVFLGDVSEDGDRFFKDSLDFNIGFLSHKSMKTMNKVVLDK